MDLPKLVALVGERAKTERPKVLLLGAGPNHNRLMKALIDLNFADVEMRCLNHLVVHGRGFNRVIFDELNGIRSEHIPTRDVYELKPEPADSIERRKEPKGPRGRWGKL